MSDVIHLLPDSVANQIAAGEVIQRPASVIKELVENAVDAGATSIQIVLKEAGRTLIQVIDNGKGMSETDARLAFERHATSKIRTADDLFTLRTMGFRGEALASIAAIAQVELRTRREEDEIGTCVRISASRCEGQESVSTPVGCNFAVRNIFFNVPARRRFLKSNQVELSAILNEFERMALINTGIAFSLIHNDTELFNLPASNLRQRIVSLFGKGMNTQLLSVEVETSLITVSGYVCRPEAARKRNALQYFFVNGRYMRHPAFHKAVTRCYEKLIGADEMPNYFLNFKVDPDTIDVNIHPTKTEIKFENEQPIWQIVSAAVRESLGKFNAVPSIDFDTDDAPDIPVYHPGDKVAQPQMGVDTTYNPFRASGGGGGTSASAYRPSRPDYDWKKLYENFTEPASADIPVADSPVEERNIPSKANFGMQFSDLPETPAAPVISGLDSAAPSGDFTAGAMYLQFKGRYILTSTKSGLMIIDQHRAHTRILFERYITGIRTRKCVSQRVLFPEMIRLTASQAAVLATVTEELSALGFELSDMGQYSYAVNGVPSGIEGVNVQQLVDQIIESASGKGSGDALSDVQERMAMVLAEAAAIPVGQLLSPVEMERLAGDLLQLETPRYTVDGKAVFTVISTDEIAKRF